MAVSVLYLYLTEQWVGLRCVIVVFPEQTHLHFGLFARKPVFGVSDKVSFKPVSLTSETGLKIKISPVANVHMILSKMCYSQTPKSRFLVASPPIFERKKTGAQCHCGTLILFLDINEFTTLFSIYFNIPYLKTSFLCV